METNFAKKIAVGRIINEILQREYSENIDLKIDYNSTTDEIIEISKKYHINWLYCASNLYIPVEIDYRNLPDNTKIFIDDLKNDFNLIKQYLPVANIELPEMDNFRNVVLSQKTKRIKRKIEDVAFYIMDIIRLKYGDNIYEVYKHIDLPFVFYDFKNQIQSVTLKDQIHTMSVFGYNIIQPKVIIIAEYILAFEFFKLIAIGKEHPAYPTQNSFIEKNDNNINRFASYAVNFYLNYHQKPCKNFASCIEEKKLNYQKFVTSQQNKIKNILETYKCCFSEKIYNKLRNDLLVKIET